MDFVEVIKRSIVGGGIEMYIVKFGWYHSSNSVTLPSDYDGDDFRDWLALKTIYDVDVTSNFNPIVGFHWDYANQKLELVGLEDSNKGVLPGGTVTAVNSVGAPTHQVFNEFIATIYGDAGEGGY